MLVHSSPALLPGVSRAGGPELICRPGGGYSEQWALHVGEWEDTPDCRRERGREGGEGGREREREGEGHE